MREKRGKRGWVWVWVTREGSARAVTRDAEAGRGDPDHDGHSWPQRHGWEFVTGIGVGNALGERKRKGKWSCILAYLAGARHGGLCTCMCRSPVRRQPEYKAPQTSVNNKEWSRVPRSPGRNSILPLPKGCILMCIVTSQKSVCVREFTSNTTRAAPHNLHSMLHTRRRTRAEGE